MHFSITFIPPSGLRNLRVNFKVKDVDCYSLLELNAGASALVLVATLADFAAFAVFAARAHFGFLVGVHC